MLGYVPLDCSVPFFGSCYFYLDFSLVMTLLEYSLGAELWGTELRGIAV